ncbi:hypothetical protein [Nocardia sp. NPDC059195]|uniref:hypothetical protein n=1 Tax=Nocardia sp. NPDC059195 TaxID=3346765 RepID=UPI00367C5888
MAAPSDHHTARADEQAPSNCRFSVAEAEMWQVDEMTWTGAAEHADLYTSAVSLIQTLRGIGSQLERGAVHYEPHHDMADRCRSLSLYLASAVADAERDAYAPAFGSLRSALEHVLIDKLISQGTQCVRILEGVEEQIWQQWDRDRKAGQGWADVLSWNWRNGVVRAKMTGPYVRGEDGTTQPIGFLYFLLDEYSPYLGLPDEQVHFDDGLTDVAERVTAAKHHRTLHATYLRWKSITESLVENQLADSQSVRMINVHNRFLSAFVHPNTNAIRQLYGKNRRTWPTYDHYSSELVLLYVNVLAAEELKSFHAMTQRPPTIGISGWADVFGQCAQAWTVSSHLWFPGQAPHEFDRFQEANRRVFRGQKSGEHPLVRPDALSDADIGYYANPLDRLIEMHSSRRELMSGLVYRSPWHRGDAQFR